MRPVCKADNLPPSCADCLEIWEPQLPGTLRACPSLYRDWNKIGLLTEVWVYVSRVYITRELPILRQQYEACKVAACQDAEFLIFKRYCWALKGVLWRRCVLQLPVLIVPPSAPNWRNIQPFWGPSCTFTLAHSASTSCVIWVTADLSVLLRRLPQLKQATCVPRV